MDVVGYVTSALLLAGVLLGICMLKNKTRAAFAARAEAAARFPPISDAEFVARCAPGTNPDVALKVRRIVADVLCVDYDRIHPSSRFVEDLRAE